MNCTSEGFPRQLSFKTDTHSFELVLKSKNRLEISCKDLPTKNGNVFYKCVITPK